MEKTYGMMAAASVIEEVQKAVIGKQDCIKKVMAAILAGGHVLIEDIPGVGKTTMAVAFSKVWAWNGTGCSLLRMCCRRILSAFLFMTGRPSSLSISRER